MPDEMFTKEWLADSRILCFRFHSTGSEASDLWSQEIAHTLAEWDKSKPLRVVIDLAKNRNRVSPDAMRRVSETANQYADVRGKIAMLLDPAASTANINAMLKHVLAGKREVKTFHDEAEAVAWLLEPD